MHRACVPIGPHFWTERQIQLIARIVFPFGIAILAVAYGLTAYGLPRMGLQEGFGPGLFPGLIACLVVTLALIEIVSRFVAYRKHQGAIPESEATTPDTDSINIQDFFNVAIIAGAVIATVIAIPLIGFVPAGTAIVFALSIVMGTRPIWKSLVIAFFTSGLVYLIFAKGFNVLFAF